MPTAPSLNSIAGVYWDKRNEGLLSGMRNHQQFLRNIGASLLLFFSFLIILVMTINANINLRTTVRLMEQSTHEFLLSSAHALSDYVSIEELHRYHTKEDIYTEDGGFTPEYRDLKDRLVRFADKYHLLYAYFWRPYGDGEIQYIADNDYSEDIATVETFFPLEARSVELIQNKVPITTDFDEYTISWSGLISGVVPVFDKDGNLYCAAGVDISDERIISQRNITRQSYILQIISIIATILTTGALFLLYRKRNEQLNVFNASLRQMVEDETKKVLALHETFGRYLSDDIVKDLLSSPDGLSLGGKKQNITVLFTDIRGFTVISEQLAEEDVVIVLNHYFSVMLEIIHKYRGTMLEFLGDGILAIFGAPVHYDDHVDSAIACALEMQITMEAVNEWNIRNGYPRMEMGVGINSGETIVGNIGAPHSMKYNVIGNTVNLASRIETFSTGGQVLISENSFQAARTKLHLGQTLQVSPKGVKTPVTVYQITGIDAPYFLELEDEDAALTELPEPAALVCYRVKDKQVDAKPLQHYMLSVSATKAVIIARQDEESLEVFENIKMLNSTGAEAFAKVVKKTDKGVILVSFTTSANDFSALAGA